MSIYINNFLYRSDCFLLLFSVSIFLSRRYDLTILPGPKSHPNTQLIQDLKTSEHVLASS